VFYLMEENATPQEAQAVSFFSNLQANGVYFSNYSAISHPSEPNYYAIYAGSDFGITDDNTHSESDPSLYSVLNTAGKTFIGFAQSPVDSPCKHTVWCMMTEGTTHQQDYDSQFPTTGAGLAALGNGIFAIIPNDQNNGHDTSPAFAGSWANSNPGIQALMTYVQAASNKAALFVLYDEDDGSGNNIVYSVCYSAYCPAGTVDPTAYNHYSLSATMGVLVGVSQASMPRNDTSATPFAQADFAAGQPAETLTATTPNPQTAGTAFTQAGTYTGGPPPSLDYSTTGVAGAYTAASATIGSGAWSFSVTIASANPSQTICVRDHTTQTIKACTNPFVVNPSGGGTAANHTVTLGLAQYCISANCANPTFTVDGTSETLTPAFNLTFGASTSPPNSAGGEGPNETCAGTKTNFTTPNISLVPGNHTLAVTVSSASEATSDLCVQSLAVDGVLQTIGNITGASSQNPLGTARFNLAGTYNFPFNVPNSSAETLTATNPGSQTAGTGFTQSGTYTNGPPASLDYSTTGVNGTYSAASATIGGGTWSFSVTIATPNSSQTICVRDHTTQTITACTTAFNVANGGAVTEQWDSTRKTSNVTISTTTTTNDTITKSGTGYVVAYGTPAVLPTGKPGAYGEFVLTSTDVSSDLQLGFALSAASTAANYWLGEDANSFGWAFNPGANYYNGGTTAMAGCNFTGWVSGDNISMAITSTKVWVRRNGGNWCGSSTANPATGVGGATLPTGMNGGNLFPGAIMNLSTDKVIAHFASSTWTYAAPSGFVPFGSTSGATEALLINQPLYRGVPVTVTGTIGNMSTAPARLDLVVDGGAPVQAVCSSITSTAYTCTWTPASAGTHTLVFVDHATSVAGPSVSVTVN
jgi:hypothetical protein